MWNQFTRFLNELFYRALSFFLPPNPLPLPSHPKLILVFSTTGIGDGLFDSAAIKSLKQGHPKAKVIVVTHHRRQSIANHNPFVEEVIPLSKSPFSQARLLRRFLGEKPDLIVALRVNEEAVPLGYLLNRHAFVGAIERCQRLSFLLSHPVCTKGMPHIVEETLKVAETAGGAHVDRGMVYRVKEEECSAFDKKQPHLRSTPYVVFQTGGGKTLLWRNWPVASYIKTIQWMKRHYPHQIILTGGSDNETAGAAIAKECPEVINLVQKTTLEETAVLLQKAAMLVSSDTGVMHLGFAINCPTLAILHYQSPARIYGPLDFSPGHEIVELSKPSSSSLHPEEEMLGIPQNKVQEAIGRILLRSKFKFKF
ncbi:MAG: hypothetical protein A3F67_06445 [Verrucomicrobia bacterium RIFCSPHIGHO2_12_FULL_41_10]|nr:MAG: hypothetical protein A3F67_06445 [Verrucomicrobia bacterium RIFCSPHIGHO2_12_FULL_41_10]